ncbi:hypothetical protein R69658_02539 [Paraburkholderia aspalathi]|uniref:Pectate lyase superfamily protein n=1 Tax=Paraburkholderia aspalathi TaxID=1324617 RepID=A0ABN7LKD2_9BURK|nr:hypothetical protein [Paraburkholderia aspalathi]MBK3817803.1 hypothetical protein [Paraburkholderia aspalathi]MBK3829581.1 hypothetical protein [Paraburkholderia aspalathi]MBK3859401.1 hypothetical protein [Paraburkholderia aspalathi]CAE6747112.1 hypothetical protein R69658_02539 [Paraburkholderia aspalathi]
MKKLLALALTLFASTAFAQTFKVQDLVINGTTIAPTVARGSNTQQIATAAFVVKHTPCPTILDFGGDNGGVVDNAAALDSAIAASPSGKACVYFPAGIYAFPSGYSYTVPSGGSVTLLGAGPDATYIYRASGNALTLYVTGSFSTARVRDMAFITGSQNTGDAISLNQTTTTLLNPANTAPSDITNVTCRGSDGYLATNYWTDCVTVRSVSNVNFQNVYASGPSAVGGNGVQLTSTSTAPGVVYNFQGCSFNWVTNGIYYGNYIQGVTVSQTNFTGGVNGIFAPSTALALDELTVTASQFNTTSNGILLQNNVPATQVIGNLFGMLFSGSVGITIQSPGLYEIVGNQFGGNLGTLQKGINLAGPSSSSGLITGNTFYKLPIAINLDATTGGVNVQSNSYNGNTTNITNLSGGNTVGGGSQ